MPIPLLFPIAGFFVSGVGVGMIVAYVRANQEKRSRLDQWMTDAAKAAIKAYLKLRYGLDLGAFTATEEQEYWRQFGDRVDNFLLVAEPIAMELYQKRFVDLTPVEQAIVARRVGLTTGEAVE